MDLIRRARFDQTTPCGRVCMLHLIRRPRFDQTRVPTCSRAKPRRTPLYGVSELGHHNYVRSPRISTDSSQTRASVPIAARQSVHDMPVVAGSLKRIKRQGSVLVRSKKLETSSQEVYQRASILAFAVQAHAEPRGDGVTAAFRSKTRRLLALPRPWRTHAPHFRARRPQWPPIPLNGELSD